MRKAWVIASREYLAAVRTKAFLLSLVILPLMMSGSLVIQWLLRDVVDIADKRFALVNHSVPPQIVTAIEESVRERNEKAIFRDGQQVESRFIIAPVEKAATTPEGLAQQRLRLSDEVRAGNLVGFLEISTVTDKQSKGSADKLLLDYRSNRPTYGDFSTFVRRVATDQAVRTFVKRRDISQQEVAFLRSPVDFESKGLYEKLEGTDQIDESSDIARFAPLFVPVALMMLMFMVVLMTATPLMQSVVEEKMNRIAEVLLGSARPFELMMGKLLGMAGVSLTIAAVYLSVAYWAAFHFGFSEYIPVDLLLWFVLYQTLSALMFGSLFIAVGAACTDMKETQNLMWPIMLLASIPLFLVGSVLKEPNSPVPRALSFFPFATPSLMIARQAVPPGIPWWEPALGICIVLLTTVACVYAAGRIFRVGILIQGKGAKFSLMIRWIFHG